MNDWNKLEFVTDEDPAPGHQKSGWSSVKFQLADEDAVDDDTIIAESFFVLFES